MAVPRRGVLRRTAAAVPLKDQEATAALALTEPTDAIVLESTSWRSLPPRATLRAAWRRRHEIGIARMADLTELDRIGIPVASATRPAVNAAQITATQGKGLTGAAAYASALMEAVERHAGAIVGRLRLASLAELDREAVAYLPPAASGERLTRTTALEWTNVACLRSGRPALAPASDIFFPYFPPPGAARPSRPSTSGLASGNTRDEAILHALLEVIERAATSSCGDEDLVLVPPASMTQTDRLLLDRFEAAGVSVCVAWLTNALMPTCSAYTYDPHWLGPRLVIGGHGTHVRPAIAVRRALCEAAQSRVVALQGSREDLRRHERQWQQLEGDGAEQFDALRQAVARRALDRLPDIPEMRCTTLRDAIACVIDRLSAAGYDRVYYRDLTAAGVGIPVVRVLVPGLVDRFVQHRNA
jgi:YcaO-like protein with predicted kinase domain